MLRSTHAPPDNKTPRSTKRRNVFALLALGAICLVVTQLWLSRPSFKDLIKDSYGTDLTQKDLSRAQQIALINSYSPIAIPASASDIEIKYQRFQDWHFKAIFTLPDRDFKAWTARLKLNPRVQLTSDTGDMLYVGKRIGSFTGSVTSSPEDHQIAIDHSSS